MDINFLGIDGSMPSGIKIHRSDGRTSQYDKCNLDVYHFFCYNSTIIVLIKRQYIMQKLNWES